MTEKEIIKNNILFARFVSDEPEVLERDLLKESTEFHYHNDILWLMDVHAKIVSIAYENKWIGFNIAINSSFVRRDTKNIVVYACTITGITHNIYFSVFSYKNIVNAMYACFIAFIQWYNEINNKQQWKKKE